MGKLNECYKCGNNHNLGSSEWTLAGLLCAKRTDRPDEWLMDEFIRGALNLESENDKLREALESIVEFLDTENNSTEDMVAHAWSTTTQALK